jgi:hypothetical protein
MSLKPQGISPIPEETARIARAAYPKGNVYTWSTILQNIQPGAYYPRTGTNTKDDSDMGLSDLNPLEVNQATDALYLGEDLFYRIIDIAVIEVHSQVTLLFVRASGHAPTVFEHTWNDPPGSGPFKQLLAKTIKVFEE